MHLIQAPDKVRKLPKTLSQQEVRRLLESIYNEKHKFMITLLYSTGMRISELLNLRPRDVDTDRGVICIRQAKGNKDRYVGLSKYVIDMLPGYYKRYKPVEFVINGASELRYTSSSARQIIKRAAKDAGIERNVTPHMLRHSYATHLLENGVSLRHVQELLGHNKPETTMIYTQLTRDSITAVTSPLDRIKETKSRFTGGFLDPNDDF
jgi:site-specific recombinase XerD